MNDSDITRAIRRPSKQSRTIDVASTRVAAAPMPCSIRAARIVRRSTASVHARLATMKSARLPASTGLRP